MRKMKQAEVAALVAGMVIGSGNLNAAETVNQLPTVTVNGQFDPGNEFVYTFINYSSVNPGSPPNYVGVLPASMAQSIQHAMSCALAYGTVPGVAPGSWAQPHRGWETFFVNSYAWTDHTGLIFETSTSSAPLLDYRLRAVRGSTWTVSRARKRVIRLYLA